MLSNTVLQNGNLAEGLLTNTTDINFGKNKLTSVPKGTVLKVTKNPATQSLYISLMIFSEKFENQFWFAGEDKIYLNCSSYSNQARVVSFYENLQLNGRCQSIKEATISTPDNGRVTLAVGAEVFLTKEGALKSATKVKGGFVYANQQKVNLHKNSFLDYDYTGKLHFLYLAPEESFTAPTTLSPKTVFKQFPGERALPILFYQNGNVESGRVALKQELFIQTRIFQQDYDLEIADGQMGFDETGRLDRTILKDELVLTVTKDRTIYFIDAQNRETIPVVLKKGETLPIPKGAHLFLSYTEDKVYLNGFPVVINGQRYFLSLRM